MRRAHGAVAAAGTVLVALLLIWGAAGGESLLSPPDTRAQADTSVTDRSDAEGPTSTTPELGTPGPDAGNGLDWWLLLQLVLIAGLLWAAWRWFRSRPPATDDDPLGAAPRDELAALLDATEEPPSPAAWAGGDARNDVVACWAALEEGVARAGLTPEPAETSADLARRVLHRWAVDERAVDRLAGLYREARFSRHEITPAHLEEAHATLAAIHGSLARASVAGSRQPDTS